MTTEEPELSNPKKYSGANTAWLAWDSSKKKHHAATNQTKNTMSKYEKQCMGIVNQLYDLAEVPVDKRQSINDRAFDYMMEQGKNLTIPNDVFTPVSKSRCCGRCDGIDDLCVSDMTCDAHNKQGCEICYGTIEVNKPN